MSDAVCTRCLGRGYEPGRGGITEDDCCVTLTCRKCGGKCACGQPMYARGQCRGCYSADLSLQTARAITSWEARCVARSTFF